MTQVGRQGTGRSSRTISKTSAGCSCSPFSDALSCSCLGWFSHVRDQQIHISPLLMLYLEIWLEWWTRANEERPNENVGYWLGGYGALGVLTLLATFLANWYVSVIHDNQLRSPRVFEMIIVPKTARRFHEILLGTTMRQVSGPVFN